MPTLATALLQGLKDHGARELFGIPSDFALSFFQVIEESRILAHYTLSHEPAVGAADAAARERRGCALRLTRAPSMPTPATRPGSPGKGTYSGT